MIIDEWHNDDRRLSINYDRLMLLCRYIFRPIVQISGQQSIALRASEGVLLHTFKSHFLQINQELQIVEETIPALQWLPYVHLAKFTTSIFNNALFWGMLCTPLMPWRIPCLPSLSHSTQSRDLSFHIILYVNIICTIIENANINLWTRSLATSLSLPWSLCSLGVQ